MADVISYPTGVQYREALYNTKLAFSDPALHGGEPVLDPLGMPKAISGNFASVFTINGTDGHRWAVKCFTRHVPDQDFRYQQVSKALQGIDSPWKVGFQYLPDGVLCRGVRYPVLKMEWVEATGLLPYIEAHLIDSMALADLARRFGDLVCDLARHGIAHGDLQHGNILVTPSGELKLIDYDGMFVPSLASRGATELGHPNYQSPFRTSDDWGPDLDRFSSWVIYASLRALAFDPLLWPMLHADGDETLLFHKRDFTSRDSSVARLALTSSAEPQLREFAKAVDFLWKPDLSAIPPLEAALGLDTASTANAAAASAPIGTDWIRQFGGGTTAAAASQASHSSAQRTGPIGAGWIRTGPIRTGLTGTGPTATGPTATGPVGTAAWVTTHLPQSPRAEFARPMAARRVFFAVLGLLTLASALATFAVPLLIFFDIVLLAMMWNLSFTTYLQTPERKEKRQCGVLFKAWRKAAAKRSRKVADVERSLRRIDRKVELRRASVLKEIDRADAEEQRWMTYLDDQCAQEIDKVNRKIKAHQVQADAEIAAALKVLGESHVAGRLLAAKVNKATIPGIGPAIQLYLSISGIVSAADFTDVRFITNPSGSVSAYFVRRDGTSVSPRGIGEKKARALNDWRLAVESDARATQPTTLPPAQQSAIIDLYAPQTRSLEREKQDIQRRTDERREKLRKDWAATHTAFDIKLNNVTARFERRRAEKETALDAARQYADTAIYHRDFARREQDRYRSICYRHYLRRLITG